MVWIPRIINDKPDYVCPVCLGAAGTEHPGPSCWRCGTRLGCHFFDEDFIKNENNWELKVASDYRLKTWKESTQ